MSELDNLIGGAKRFAVAKAPIGVQMKRLIHLVFLCGVLVGLLTAFAVDAVLGLK